jgi:hypothetical protein
LIEHRRENLVIYDFKVYIKKESFSRNLTEKIDGITEVLHSDFLNLNLGYLKEHCKMIQEKFIGELLYNNDLLKCKPVE